MTTVTNGSSIIRDAASLVLFAFTGWRPWLPTAPLHQRQPSDRPPRYLRPKSHPCWTLTPCTTRSAKGLPFIGGPSARYRQADGTASDWSTAPAGRSCPRSQRSLGCPPTRWKSTPIEGRLTQCERLETVDRTGRSERRLDERHSAADHDVLMRDHVVQDVVERSRG
jgi:hypothetical protein